MTINEILQSLSIRSTGSRWGIGTALQYVRSVDSCFSGGGTKLADLKFADADLWAKELAEASLRLTYCDSEMAGFDLTKSINEGTGITSGAVLEYDCILSSRRKDRDGDILESKGLEIDVKMPLLWQHIQVQPIGKHVAVLSQSDDLVKCKFAIADTTLGRDAAILTKFGALRKSHGFKPFDFAPVEVVKGAGPNGQDVVRGWHVKRAAVMEGSLVSIPANTDGNVTAVYEKAFAGQLDGIRTAAGRDLLADPLVKTWAKSILDSRPVQSPGVTLASKADAAGQPISGRYKFNDVAERWYDTIEKKFVSAADVGLQAKANGLDVVTSGVGPVRQGQSVSVGADSSNGAQAATGDNNGKCSACGKGQYDSTGTCPNCGAQRSNPSPGKPSTPPAGITINIGSDVIVGRSLPGLLTKEMGDALATAHASLETKDYGDPYLDGSYEQLSWLLRKSARAYLTAQSGESVDSYVDVIGTFPTNAIVSLYDYRSSKTLCYQIDWTTGDDGRPKWTGTPKAVEIKQQIVEKYFAELRTKAAGLAASNIATPPEPTAAQLARSLASKAVLGDAAAIQALEITASAREAVRLNSQLLPL